MLAVDRRRPASVIGEIEGSPQTRTHLVNDVRLERRERILSFDLAAKELLVVPGQAGNVSELD